MYYKEIELQARYEYLDILRDYEQHLANIHHRKVIAVCYDEQNEYYYYSVHHNSKQQKIIDNDDLKYLPIYEFSGKMNTKNYKKYSSRYGIRHEVGEKYWDGSEIIEEVNEKLNN